MSDCVLDASALIAWLNNEQGADQVAQRVARGEAAISAVNLCEVVARCLELGFIEAALRARIASVGVQVVAFDSELAFDAGRLRRGLRGLGISLADTACLALARHLGLPAVTADRAWATLGLSISVELIR